MKLNTLLTGGFLIVASLCGVVGYRAINTFENVEGINAKVQADTVPSTILMFKIQVLANKVHLKETEYIVYRKFKGKAAEIKEELKKAMGELKEVVDEHFERHRHKGKEERLDAQQFLDEVATLNYAVNGILDFVDVQVGYTEEIHEQIAEMEDETVGSAYRDLTEHIVEHKAEHIQKLSDANENVISAHVAGRTAILAITIIMVILAMVLGIIISRSISNPILELRTATAEVGKGKLDTRVEIKSKNEIGELAASFNQMTENLKKVTASRDELNKEIIERKKAEEALRQTAQEWGTTFESITDMVSIHDKDFKIVRANKSFTDTFNIKPEEIIGKNCYELMHGTKEPPSFCPHKQVLETGKPHCTEVFEPHLEIYIEVSISPIFDENGQAIATAHIVKDITERKRVEEQVWRKTAVVEAINNVFQETLVCETEEQVAYTCISMAEELTGSKYGLIGEVNEAGRFDTISYGDLGWAICKMPESEAVSLSKNMELRGIWAQAILKEKSQIVNSPTSHPDSVGTPEGHPPITSFLGVPLKHAGKTIGMIGLANKEGGYGPVDQEAVESLSVAFVEALRRKRAEQDLKNLNKELQATVEKLTLANRELQHFAHIAAHDLKAPLRAIGTLADWISTDYADKFDEEGKREVELLVGRAVRMSDMIDSILRYSEAGRAIKEKEKVNLNALIEEVMAGIAPPENISVTVENELPVVEGEKTHFVQVFQNLLSNAVKYMDKPIGQIKVGCTEENGFWKFSVADNGPGVEKEYFERIFEMFQTLLPRDEFETTGIGLSIVKKIVEACGGRVWIESEVGRGSVFFFTLPNQEMKVADDAKLKANIVS